MHSHNVWKITLALLAYLVFCVFVLCFSTPDFAAGNANQPSAAVPHATAAKAPLSGTRAGF